MGLSSSTQGVKQEETKIFVSSTNTGESRDRNVFDVSTIGGEWKTIRKIMENLTSNEKIEGYYNLDTGRQITSRQTISSKKFRSESLRCLSDKEDTIKLVRQIIAKYKDNKEELPKKKQRTPLPPKLRDEVWTRYCGDHIKGKCYVCDGEISYMQMKWECGHVKAWAKGGEDIIENLRPICPACNRSMGDTHMKDFAINNGYKVHPSLK